ncbi:MAG: 6-carboxyhexanoate--CoA ligase [Hydrogenothermus sp.]|nr:MAG: 6-carboxyhexanoate--CoA ligase [Hydrogenothermus sp.]
MLYSIKIRTSLEEKHISGAERIVSKEKIPNIVKALLERQKHKEFDFSNIKIEKISQEPIILEKSLKIETYEFKNYEEALSFALNIMSEKTNIHLETAKKFINLLYIGASPDKNNMRGAMIVNEKGERLEKDKFRGVRTVLVDFINRDRITEKLLEKGYTERTVDALALATKNLNYKKLIAEFCISDDEDYTTGYLAIDGKYIRLKPLKPYGLDKGGRIYFVKNDTNIDELYNYLEKIPVLIEDINE